VDSGSEVASQWQPSGSSSADREAMICRRECKDFRRSTKAGEENRKSNGMQRLPEYLPLYDTERSTKAQTDKQMETHVPAANQIMAKQTEARSKSRYAGIAWSRSTSRTSTTDTMTSGSRRLPSMTRGERN
jgi:hypothetical protein